MSEGSQTAGHRISSPSSAGAFASSGCGLLPLYPTSTHASILDRPLSPPSHVHDRTFIMELLTTFLAVQVKFSEVHLLKGVTESNRGARESGCQKRPAL